MNEIGFVVKKIVSAFCYPLGFSLVIMCLGIVLWRRKPGSRWGFALTVAGLILLVVMSLPITGYLLMRPLEDQAGTYANPEDLRRQGVKYIVVLGASIARSDVPPAERFGTGILRVMEGIRLWKGIPGSRLVLSGGSVPGRRSQKEAMAELPEQLGVPREALVLETRAMDTADEALLFSRLLGKQPFALVTSARHMSRAVQHFKALGLSPISCPCDFATRLPPPLYSWFLPGEGALSLSQHAIHNYMGSIWLYLKVTLMGQYAAPGPQTTLTGRQKNYPQITPMDTDCKNKKMIFCVFSSV